MSLRMRASRAEEFERLAAEYERPLYLLCLRMTGNVEDAQDCAQEALVRAFQAFDRFHGEKYQKTWLYRIAYNVCIDALRRRRGVTSLDALREAGFDVADTRIAEPEAAVSQAELRAQIREAVAALPDDQRAVLILRDFQQLSYEEIARIVRLPEGTVKSRLNRAREKLKNFLRQAEQTDGLSVQRKGGRQR